MRVNSFFSFIPGGFTNAASEKIALELSYPFCVSGMSSLVQVRGEEGLSSLYDPLMSIVYMGTSGSLVLYVVSEAASKVLRALCFFTKAPCIFSGDDVEEFLNIAFSLSGRFSIPVIVVGKYALSDSDVVIDEGRFSFSKAPERWAATPRFRYFLHKELNRKLDSIRSYVCSEMGRFLKVVGSGERAISEIPIDGFKTTVCPFSFPLPVGSLLDLHGRALSFTDSPSIWWQLSGIVPLKMLNMESSHRVEEEVKELSGEILSLADGFDTVVTDIPVSAPGMDVLVVPMGSSPGVAAGMAKAGRSVISITDETSLLHSGIFSVLNASYNRLPLRMIVLGGLDRSLVNLLNSFGVKVLESGEPFSSIHSFPGTVEVVIA